MNDVETDSQIDFVLPLSSGDDEDFADASDLLLEESTVDGAARGESPAEEQSWSPRILLNSLWPSFLRRSRPTTDEQRARPTASEQRPRPTAAAQGAHPSTSEPRSRPTTGEQRPLPITGEPRPRSSSEAWSREVTHTRPVLADTGSLSSAVSLPQQPVAEGRRVTGPPGGVEAQPTHPTSGASLAETPNTQGQIRKNEGELSATERTVSSTPRQLFNTNEIQPQQLNRSIESAFSSRRQDDHLHEINPSGFNASATNTSYITQCEQAEKLKTARGLQYESTTESDCRSEDPKQSVVGCRRSICSSKRTDGQSAAATADI